VSGGGDVGQRFQCARGLDGRANRPRRHPVLRGEARTDGTASVEDRDHGELLDVEASLLANELLAVGPEPRGVVALELVEAIPQPEHRDHPNMEV
jgi:hypothetical protein